MVVRVMFYDSSREYDYLTDIRLAVGDYVVVPTGKRMGIARVNRVGRSSSRAVKWVIQKIDLAGYEERMRKKDEHEDAEY